MARWKKERKKRKEKNWESSESALAPTVTHNAAEARACRGNGKKFGMDLLYTKDGMVEQTKTPRRCHKVAINFPRGKKYS